MDVVQVVEEAVLSGAAGAAKDQASALVTSAVTALGAVIARVFGADPIARTAVEQLNAGPPDDAEVWRQQLRGRLQALPEADLRELLKQAQAVLALSDPEGTAAGRYTVTAGEIGTVVGGNVEIHAETHGVPGRTIGNVSMGGGSPPEA